MRLAWSTSSSKSHISLVQNILSFSSAWLSLGRSHLSLEHMEEKKKKEDLDAAFMEKNVFWEKSVMKSSKLEVTVLL